MMDLQYTANVLRATAAGLREIATGIPHNNNAIPWVLLRLESLAARIANEIREMEATTPDTQNDMDILRQDGERWRGIAMDFKRDLDQVRCENVQLYLRLRHAENKSNPEGTTP